MLTFRDIARIFEEIELRLIASLKRNLSGHKQWEEDEGFQWSAWQAEKLSSIEKFRKENLDIVSEYTDVIDNETRELMQEQFREGALLTEKKIKEAGEELTEKIEDSAVIRKQPQPAFFGADSRKLGNLIQEITQLEKNVETAALRMTDDVYRQTLHRVQLAMASGSMTLNQAIDLAVKDFLDKGLNCIVYSDGRRVNIADYVRMALFTTSTRAKLQGEAQRAYEMGYDTVIVSQYGMCSETCLPWQGRVYIDDVFILWDGEIEERENGELWGKSHYCDKWFPLLSTAVHKGLFHPNCRHSVSVWIEGRMELPKPLDGQKVRERSALEQKQRALERKVRKAKRLVVGSFNPAQIKKSKKKLREAQKELREFVEAHSDILRRDSSREKIYTADKPKTVDNSGGSGIIKVIRKSVEIPQNCKHLLKADTNFKDKDISLDILQTINDTIEEKYSEKSDFIFDEIKIAKFADTDKSIFITNYEVGAHSKTQLYLNKRFLLDVSEESVNNRCLEHYNSNWWKSKSLKDLVTHEIMHAKINYHNSFEKAERMYQTLREDLRVKGFCRLVDAHPDEFMNEMYVALNNGEKIEQKYMDVYNEYLTEFLGG